ncbi:ABC transporter substrate-binding protein [Streptomyces sp. NPDC059740]|uniref:ABC transporter substrate-binding protein n=1 Tax=Streptomyces sp. NPDC059740 TaxID=3346926 RepID=UPI0036591BD2
MWRRSRTGRVRASVLALSAGALVLTACSAGAKPEGGGADDGRKDAQRQQAQVISFGGADVSKGPAPGISGARKGGTLTVYQRDDFDTLDPGQIWTPDESAVETLLTRRLTTYRHDEDGKYTVVGDLATDSGEMSDGGKTWTYHLKDGIRFEDGSPITSQDIRHSVERLFAPFMTDGPNYLQQWLAGGTDFRKLLPGGGYDGKHLPKSVLETPDSKTVVFHFHKAVGDLPFALTMCGYGVVPHGAKDTREKYAKKPLSSGPYKVAPGSYQKGKGIRLVRNTAWDPKTDATRHQYVDAFDVQSGVEYSVSTQRLISDSDQNRTAVSFTNQVDAANLQKVADDPDVKKRSISGYQPYVGNMVFNMSRLKDKRIREAIAYALPVQSIVDAYGTPGGGELAGGYIGPTLSGYKDIDPYGKLKKPQGDVAKAKKILKAAGKSGMKLTFAHRDDEESQNFAVAVADNLHKAGFDVQNVTISADSYYKTIGNLKNPYDIFPTSWSSDWPSAFSVIPPTLDGRLIAEGAPNYSHYDNPAVNKEIDRISQITDTRKAADEWFALSERILKDDLPQLPTLYYKYVQVAGSKVGGVVADDILSGVDPTRLYVKQ